MRRKIAIGTAVITLAMLGLAAQIYYSMHKQSTRLDELLKMHQVEILREHLMIRVSEVQSDLHMRNTRFARTGPVVSAHVVNMQRIAASCADCHHTIATTRTIEDLKTQIDQYAKAVSSAIHPAAGTDATSQPEEAVALGEEITRSIHRIINHTQMKLQEKNRVVQRELDLSKSILILLIVLVPLLGIIHTFLLARQLAHPFNVLSTAAGRLKAGDLDHRVEKLPDEFGEVATSFNEMAVALKEQFTKMGRAEQMVQLGEMAAGLAHEIKNPLAGIKVSVEVLSQQPHFSVEDKAILQRVAGEIRRIEGLMKDLLNFAKPPRPQLTRVSPNAVLRLTLNLARQHPAFAREGAVAVTILEDFEADLPLLTADPAQLQQAFLNLVLNAAEAMPAGGTITITSARSLVDSSLIMTVRDTGRGIDPLVADKIFLPFVTTKPKGTGLGLPITRRLIEQMGGTITAASPPGGGALFTIRLPIPAGPGGDTP